jgi:hypothetical protein
LSGYLGPEHLSVVPLHTKLFGLDEPAIKSITVSQTVPKWAVASSKRVVPEHVKMAILEQEKGAKMSETDPRLQSTIQPKRGLSSLFPQSAQTLETAA